MIFWPKSAKMESCPSMPSLNSCSSPDMLMGNLPEVEHVEISSFTSPWKDSHCGVEHLKGRWNPCAFQYHCITPGWRHRTSHIASWSMDMCNKRISMVQPFHRGFTWHGELHFAICTSCLCYVYIQSLRNTKCQSVAKVQRLPSGNLI